MRGTVLSKFSCKHMRTELLSVRSVLRVPE